LQKPAEFLPDVSGPTAPTVWHFPGWTREKTLEFLASCGLSEHQRVVLSATSALTVTTNGSSITPSADAVLSLSRESRAMIYGQLARSADNIAYQHPFRIRLAEADSWFARSGLPASKVDLAKKLCYRRGNALCFADVEIAHRFLNRSEFTRLLRALYSSDTLLLRLRVEPGDSIDQLAAYWSHGGHTSSVKALLQSVANFGGGEIDVADLLPPLPRMWLYTYPQAPLSSPSEGDCFSTSLNFFRASAEKSFLQPAARNDAFRRHYRVVPKWERLGDIIVFADARGATLHACVFVADDIVFTKNGAQNSHPWVFMRLDLVRELYAETGSEQIYVFRWTDS
jgi:hypothetical protein